MPKSLSYAQAVRVLGQGPDADWLRRINDLTGGLMLGAAVTVPAVLGWFDAHAVFAKLSQQLVQAAGRRLAGANRLDRTERIAAAHTIIVVSAYFDALAEVDLPFDLAAAKLTAEDQLSLAGRDGSRAGDLAQAALRVGIFLPEAHGFRREYLDTLGVTYRELSTAVGAFLRGLALWDELSPGQAAEVDRALGRVPVRARERYEQLLLDLRIDCPEVDLWLREQQATAMLFSVGETHDLMRRLAGPAATPTGAAYLLTRAYRALLERPVAETGDLPAGLGVPSLREAYLPSLFRVTEAAPDFPASDEQVWADLPVRSDLHQMLAGYLTSPRARSAPIVVLGQPGAGKSVLTKVLAAGLVEGDFLPVRVPLRDVDTSLDLQRQIEQAVQATTTETITWPRLAEAADGRLPVILLDGFDELLQATATSQSDYLYKVADFQQRERDLGRAVAVLVTTRTSVADRAAAPPDTLLLRLEPFDDARVTAWLAAWERTNSARLAARGLRTLPAEVALRFPDLAEQPLLLLLLALYDADENALQHTGELSPSELYERLLTSFARREVRKAGPHFSAEQCEAAVEEELRRLSVVAFAMLNRSAQWVTEADLERDLAAVFGAAPGADGDVTVATLLLGRFFFVHRAQAVRGRQTLQTYEFLHATFGEYLVARFTWQLLAEAVARASVTVSPAWTDDGLLSRMLSFAPLVVRAPILRFLGRMASRLTGDERDRWTQTLVSLYRRSQHLTWTAQAGEYRPITLRMPARYAAYTANLVLLAVTVAGELDFATMAEPGPADPGRQWHDQALLWHSQLPDEGWEQLVQAIEIDRFWTAEGIRDLCLKISQGNLGVAAVDSRWVFEQPGHTGYFDLSGYLSPGFRTAVQFDGGGQSHALLHAVEPLLRTPLAGILWQFDSEGRSVAHTLLTALLLEPSDMTVWPAYLRLADFVLEGERTDAEVLALGRLLLNALQTDPRVPIVVVLEVARRWRWDSVLLRLAPAFVEMAAAVLSRASVNLEAARELAEICLQAAGTQANWDKHSRRALCTVIAAARARPFEPAPGDIAAGPNTTADQFRADVQLRLTEISLRLTGLNGELHLTADRIEDLAGRSILGEPPLGTAVRTLRQAANYPIELRAVLDYVMDQLQ